MGDDSATVSSVGADIQVVVYAREEAWSAPDWDSRITQEVDSARITMLHLAAQKRRAHGLPVVNALIK